MAVARTNNGSKMKTNKDCVSMKPSCFRWIPMTSPFLPNKRRAEARIESLVAMPSVEATSIK